MSSIIISNGKIVNEGRAFTGDILIVNDSIHSVGMVDPPDIPAGTTVIDASGMIVIPGIIDDQVHFRDPGLTHKGDIFTETRAAAAGGVTSFMDMPNTIPPAVTRDILEEKYRIASEKSLINYSFYIGGTNSNLDELLSADPESVCGIKLFLGSSTGTLLVNDEETLKEIFSRTSMLVACHCEYDPIIKKNSEEYRTRYGEDVPAGCHPRIRSREACFTSSSHAVSLAREYNTRLNVLHLSTADEMKLFSSSIPVDQKRITAELCVHHLWFEESDYERLGNLIKWNPSIKTRFDRDALIDAVNNNVADIIATDHAPHTLEEKKASYFKAPSGGPLIQHSLHAMMELHRRGIIPLTTIVEKMCHNPAIIYRIRNRGFIREGFKADIAIIDPSAKWKVTRENILYKCGWSPFEGYEFSTMVKYTIVNGNIVYNNGIPDEGYRGERLKFNTK